MRYLYCPKCGTKLIGRAAGDDGDVPFCTICNRYWFDRFSCCVIILVANEYNELAMIRQYRLSEQYWTYVAGFITPARLLKKRLNVKCRKNSAYGSIALNTAELTGSPTMNS